jgi:gamma-glutamylcyclotransferase (GGCT)/AIG2-like uncharacterized protein YtfP
MIQLNHQLFVYGTLISGASHDLAKQFHDQVSLIGKARWAGRLFNVNNYPGAIPSTDGKFWVTGELWHLKDPHKILSFLDDYEECSASHPIPHEYKRSIEIIVVGEQTISAWMYVYQLPTTSLLEISSGVFKE